MLGVSSSSSAIDAAGRLKTEPEDSGAAGRFLEFRPAAGFFWMGASEGAGSPSLFRNSHSASKFFLGAMPNGHALAWIEPAIAGDQCVDTATITFASGTNDRF